MADCSPSQNCGSPDVPFGPPDAGEPPPGSNGQPDQLPFATDTCGAQCCPSSTVGSNASTGSDPLDTARRAVLMIAESARPSAPGSLAPSSGINVSNGNLFYTIPVVKSGPYAPPSALTYNARASGQAIQYGSGVAGLYNQTLRMIDADTVDLTKGDGRTWRYTDYNSGSGYYLAPARARNSLKRTAAGWTETQPDGLQFSYQLFPLGWVELDLPGWESMTLGDWNDFALSGMAAGTYGRLANLTNRGAQTWTLTYDGGTGALQRITDPFSRLTT